MGERLLPQLNCVKATSVILGLALGSLGHEVGVCVYLHELKRPVKDLRIRAYY